VSEMADFAGVARSTIYDWQKLSGWPSAPDGSVALWDIAVWRDRLIAGDDLAPEGEGDGAGASPGLERYRLARAAQEEIKLSVMRKAYLDRNWVHSWLGELGSLLRICGEQLQREHGQDALDIMDQTLKEFGERVRKMFEDAVSDETGE
jgi:hypothetical protein